MISATSLSSYLYCPRKLFLDKVLKLKEPPKGVLILGTVRHETMDLMTKGFEILVASIQDREVPHTIKERFRREHLKVMRDVILKNKQDIEAVSLTPSDVFTHALPYITKESERRSNHVIETMAKFNVYGPELWNVLTPKLTSELGVESSQLGIRGIIDLIEVHPGRMIPVELKTGSAPREGVWPGHKIQLGTYAMLIEEKFGNPVEEGFVEYLDHDDRRRVSINIFLKEEIKELIGTVNDLLKSKELPPILENRSKCKSCGLREQCYNESFMKDKMEEVGAKAIQH